MILDLDDVTITLDVQVRAKHYKAYKGWREEGAQMEPDEPESYEITAIKAPKPMPGISTPVYTDITWLFSDDDIRKLEERLLEKGE